MPLTLLLVVHSPVDPTLWQRFRRDPNAALSLSELGVVASIVGTMLIVWWLLAKWHQVRDCQHFSSPAGLFRELCRAHQLSRRQKAMLKSLADAQRLEQPAQVFLRPDLFWPPQVPPKLAARHRELVQLHGRIFSGQKQPPTVAANAEREAVSV